MVVSLFLAIGTGSVPAQDGSTLFGDFTVVDFPEDATASATFQILLINRGGSRVGRENLGPRGRYRFFGIRNGEYQLVVLSEDREVYREFVRLQEVRPTQVRKDIQLQWRQSGDDTPDAAAAILYARSKKAQEWMAEARARIGAKKPKAAIKLLDKIVAEDAEDFEAWTELGGSYFQTGDLKKASSAYSSALQRRPEFLPALVNLGKVHFSREEYTEATETLGRAIALNENLPEAHYFLAESYLRLKKGSLAVEHFKVSLQQAPDKMADAHLRMGALYRAAGLSSQAAQEFSEYLKKRPDYEQRAALEKYIAANR